jgi:hypothetical protein
LNAVIERDGQKIGLELVINEDTVLTDRLVERIGKLSGDAVRRKLTAMLCEQDGHTDIQAIPTIGTLCGRCHLVLEEV